MKPFDLKKPILVPLTLAIVFFLGAFVVGLHRFEKRSINDRVARKLQFVNNVFEEQLDSDAHMMTTSLHMLLGDKQLKAALMAKDRRGLLERTLALFGELRAVHRITHFYFTGPDRVNILRVHKPDRYGDKIDRFTTVEAEKAGEHTYGIELGPLGTFTLRAVTPWYDGEQLIGFVELGEEIEHITRKLHHILGVEIYVVIEKEYLNRVDWESGMRMLGRDATWDRFPSVVMIDQTQDKFPESLAELLGKRGYTSMVNEVDVSFNDQYYRAGFIRLKDAGGRGVGDMIVMVDVTEEEARLHGTVFIVSAICLVVGGILFILLFLFVRQVEQHMATAHKELIRVSKAVESTSDAVVMMNPSGQAVYQNRASLEVFGYTVEEFNKAGGPSILCADPAVAHEVLDNIKGGNFWLGEVKMRTRDGRTVPVLLRAHPIKGEIEEILGYICIHTDITERVQAEEALRKISEEQTLLLDNIDTQIWYLTDLENHGAVNKALADFLGVQKSDVANKNIYEILSKEEADVCVAGNREVFESKRKVRTEEWVKNGRGELRLLSISKTPKLDKAGNVEYVVCAAEDITERKQVEEALLESEQKIKAILKNVHDVIFRVSPSGYIKYVTPNVKELYGYEVEELLGQHLNKTTPSREVLRALQAVKSCFSGETIENFEISQIDAKGNIILMEVALTPVKEGGKIIAVQGVMRDITERKRVAEELKKHRDHLEELVAERAAELTRTNKQLQQEITERQRAEKRLLTYHKRLRSLASALSLAEERERRRIATEVHDHVGQNLAFAKLKLATLLKKISSSSEQKAADELNTLIDEAIRDTRFLVSEFGSPVLYELGFVPAVEWLTQQTQKRHGIVVDFEDDGQPKPLSDDVRVLLFQAVRELLANI
ncbi:MAG: PAS domain S-box protein, partial [Desulfobacterales bacterium]